MIVCSCRAVGDGEIRDAIDHGADTIQDVAQMCGAGSRCRGCWGSLQQILDASPPAARAEGPGALTRA